MNVEMTTSTMLVINMEKNAQEHLEFEVVKAADGKFSVIDHLCDGKIIYTGFPSRKEAEKFVLSQPECWE